MPGNSKDTNDKNTNRGTDEGRNKRHSFRTLMLEDVAYAALYLASDESSMLTGTNINVDGGRGI